VFEWPAEIETGIYRSVDRGEIALIVSFGLLKLSEEIRPRRPEAKVVRRGLSNQSCPV
jgi:hypothetical protein